MPGSCALRTLSYVLESLVYEARRRIAADPIWIARVQLAPRAARRGQGVIVGSWTFDTAHTPSTISGGTTRTQLIPKATSPPRSDA